VLPVDGLIPVITGPVPVTTTGTVVVDVDVVEADVVVEDEVELDEGGEVRGGTARSLACVGWALPDVELGAATWLGLEPLVNATASAPAPPTTSIANSATAPMSIRSGGIFLRRLGWMGSYIAVGSSTP
jgi:hypothetical protein